MLCIVEAIAVTTQIVAILLLQRGVCSGDIKRKRTELVKVKANTGSDSLIVISGEHATTIQRHIVQPAPGGFRRPEKGIIDIVMPDGCWFSQRRLIAHLPFTG